MARKWTNLNLPGALHYVTGNVNHRIKIFTGDRRFLREKPDRDGSIHQVWQQSFKAFPLWSGWMNQAPLF